MQFKQLRIKAWKSQDYNEVWTCNLAKPVRRSKQLSYEALTLWARHLWVLMSPWRTDVKWYMKCFINWTADFELCIITKTLNYVSLPKRSRQEIPTDRSQASAAVWGVLGESSLRKCWNLEARKCYFNYLIFGLKLGCVTQAPPAPPSLSLQQIFSLKFLCLLLQIVY